MIDVNYPIRQAYISLLTGAVILNYDEVPIYYAQIPTGDKPDNYILINSISNVGFNSDCSNYTNTVVQLMIVTKALQNNDGAAADDIANQIFQIIYPNPQAQAVQIDNGQVIGTTLSLDRVLTGLTDGQKKVVNRIISFQHVISHN